MHQERDPDVSKNSGPIIYRLLPALCVLSAFAGIALLYLFGPRELYIAILEHSGFNPYKFPFLDFHGGLAAWECARQGIDVVVTDPCDVLRRPYNYGPIWMAFSFIPLGTADTAWSGLILGLCFIASLTFVPAVKKPWELALIVVASLSTMMVLALERGNPDMMVFMLALAWRILRWGHCCHDCSPIYWFFSGFLQILPARDAGPHGERTDWRIPGGQFRDGGPQHPLRSDLPIARSLAGFR
jgi:hypothetical protein